jgi:hypothetical protein
MAFLLLILLAVVLVVVLTSGIGPVTTVRRSRPRVVEEIVYEERPQVVEEVVDEVEAPRPRTRRRVVEY